MPEFDIRCACCGGAEPLSGWHSFAVIDGEIDEAYCSENCFVGHEDKTCGCIVDDEFSALDDDET